MIIGIDMGHTLSGAGTGASGYVKETVKNREVGNRLIEMLKENGHTVINCTVDLSNNDLYDRVKKANAQKLDLFVSLHLNAFKTTTNAMGVETYIYNQPYPTKAENKAIAQRIQTELVNKVGWRNRGVKEENFYVLRETVANAVLIELGFCDSKADMDKWNTETIAKAIYKGITQTDYKQKTTTTTTNGVTFYRVVVGSYKDKANAQAQVEKLKKAGFNCFIDIYKN